MAAIPRQENHIYFVPPKKEEPIVRTLVAVTTTGEEQIPFRHYATSPFQDANIKLQDLVQDFDSQLTSLFIEKIKNLVKQWGSAVEAFQLYKAAVEIAYSSKNEKLREKVAVPYARFQFGAIHRKRQECLVKLMNEASFLLERLQISTPSRREGLQQEFERFQSIDPFGNLYADEEKE